MSVKPNNSVKRGFPAASSYFERKTAHMVRSIIALALGISSSISPAFAEDVGVPEFVTADQSRVVSLWLSKNPGYRVATDEDCRCADDLKRVRQESVGAWKAIPGYHPYYVTGDFNWDGIQDVAFGVVRGKSPSKFKVIIFHGPIESKHSGRAAYVSESLLLGQGFFYGPPRPLPYMLGVGPFESEGAVLKPSVKGYKWLDDTEEER